MKKWSIFLTIFFFSLFFCTLKYANMIRISNISFFRFCWKNGKLDWPKCARTLYAYAANEISLIRARLTEIKWALSPIHTRTWCDLHLLTTSKWPYANRGRDMSFFYVILFQLYRAHWRIFPSSNRQSLQSKNYDILETGQRTVSK